MGPQQVMPQLVLLGELAWREAGRRVLVPRGTPSSIVGLLAQHQGSLVTVDRILDELWDEPPGSGANAVQRHISTVRRELRDRHLPASAIETRPGGYRRHPEVVTDAELLDDLLAVPADHLPQPGGHADNGDVAWWREPLSGLPWEPHALLRSQVNWKALQVALRWARAALGAGRAQQVCAVLCDLSGRYDEPELWALLEEAAALSGNAELQRLARRTSPTPATENGSARRRRQPLDGHAALDLTMANWGRGDVDGAFGALEEAAPQLSPDVARRAGRALVWSSPRDRFAAVLWRQVPGLARILPEQSERAFVSLDAYALEQMHDGLHVADGEVDRAKDRDELVRALRVRFLVGMSHPISDQQRAVVEHLESINTSAAQVEAARFRFLLAVKRGDFDDAGKLLTTYESVVARNWGDTDDFAALANIVLATGPGVGARGPTDGSQPGPFMATQRSIDTTTAWTRLCCSTDVASADTQAAFHGAMSGASPLLANVMAALHCHRLDGAHVSRSQVAALADQMPNIGPGRHRHALLGFLGQVALETRDEELAAHVLPQLVPWGNEQLGLWPLELLIGSASQLVSRLAKLTRTLV